MVPSDDPIHVVFIRSVGHSGSTLLDMMISSHSRVVSVGEVARLHEDPDLRCTCGADTIRDCPFWQAVDRVLRRDQPDTEAAETPESEPMGEVARAGADRWRGGGLDAIDLASDDPRRFERDNLRFFRAVAEVSDRGIIVDSTKDMKRLRSFAAIRAFKVSVIYLRRSPFGLAWSYVKRDRSLRDATDHCLHDLSYTRRALTSDPIRVRYEKLVANPRAVLARIMERLGLEFEPRQLEWAARERHNYGGNLMRFSIDSTIRRDVGWRSGLTWRQKAAVAVRVGPAALFPRIARQWHSLFNADVRRHTLRRLWRRPYVGARTLVGRCLRTAGLKHAEPGA